MVNGQTGVTVHKLVVMQHRLELKSVWIHLGNNAQNRHVKGKVSKTKSSNDRVIRQWPVQVSCRSIMFKSDICALK